MVISSSKGESITRWMQRRYEHRKFFGVIVRPVAFADHRHGLSALRVEIGLFFWEFVFYPIKWHTRYKRSEGRVVTLAEQVKRDHGWGFGKLEEVEDEAI